MFDYSIIQWIFFFYFYCFFGWCFETTYVSLKNGKYVNRGFMRGPFLPLYGSGAIMLLVVSKPFEKNIILVYLAGCVGATVLEYVTGVTMEALFKVRYWDYSYKKIQFQGHICLSSTLAWGFLTILMTYVVHRQVEFVVFLIPTGFLTILTFILTACVFADFSLAFKAAIDLRDVLVKMEQTKAEIGRIQKRLDVIIAFTEDDIVNRSIEIKEMFSEYTEEFLETMENRVEDFSEKRDSFVEGLTKHKEEWEKKQLLLMEDLDKKFRMLSRRHPTMDSIHFKETFEQLKNRIEDRMNSKY